MKTIFDKATEAELISRINLLSEDSKAQWGKMNVHQMINHCILADEHYLGTRPYSRTFLGRIIGPLALKQLLKDESPMGRNAPTRPELKIAETTGNLDDEKKQWAGLIKDYEKFSSPEFIHWFFGKMTKEQVGQLAYKHNDHHLRQFGA
jgi:hypothetical protein